MKQLLSKILALSLCLAVAAGAPGDTYTILVTTGTGLVAGPFTHDPQAAAGQQKIALDESQLNTLNDLRAAHVGSRFVLADGVFSVHPVDVIRAGLIAEYQELSPGEQILYRDAFRGVRDMLDLDNLTEARKIIFLSPVATEELAASRARMLALFPAE